MITHIFNNLYNTKPGKIVANIVFCNYNTNTSNRAHERELWNRSCKSLQFYKTIRTYLKINAFQKGEQSLL